MILVRTLRCSLLISGIHHYDCKGGRGDKLLYRRCQSYRRALMAGRVEIYGRAVVNLS